MLPLHAGRDRHLASRQFFLISTLRQRSRHFRLGQQRAPFTVEALESAAGNTGNTDNYLAPPNHFQPTVRPMNETGNLQRKGRKGRKPLEQFAVRDSSAISDTSLPLAPRCRRRFGAQWLGANRQILPAQTFHRETVRSFAVSPTGCSPPQNWTAPHW